VPSRIHRAWPEISDSERESVSRVLDAGVLTGSNGRETTALQAAWSERLGIRHCVAVSSGTAALHCCAVGTGLEPGDEVIVPAVSFVASAYGLAHHGVTPVFCDIEPDTFNLDVAAAGSLVTERTRAVLAVHLHGLPCDMDAVEGFARRHGLVVIEDAAQAHGARYHDREVGSFGAAAAFSLNATKHLPAGEGGLFVTDDDDAWDAARRLALLGEISPPRKPDHFRSYWSLGLGWNYRMSEVTAALARARIPRLTTLIESAQATAAVLTDGLARIPGIIPPVTPPDRTHVFHKYRVRLDARALGFDGPPAELRDRVLWALNAEGVEAVVWQLFPLPALPAFRRPTLRPWTSAAAAEALARWDPEPFRNATQMLDESLVLGSEQFPLFHQSGDLAARYVEACVRVFEHLDEVLERPHVELRLSDGPPARL
jgi:dTDP-4-amino-4,6-dideoxygalactose transaminase